MEKDFCSISLDVREQNKQLSNQQDTLDFVGSPSPLDTGSSVASAVFL